MWAGLRVEISCFSTTSTDALNMVGTAVQPVISHSNIAEIINKARRDPTESARKKAH